MPVGDLVYIRYQDHTLFRDIVAGNGCPVIREAVGWLAHENGEFVRLVFERYAVPQSEGAQRETGLAILKNTILEMRVLFNALERTQPVGGRIK